MTLSLLYYFKIILNYFKISVWFVRIEDLIAVHDGDEVFSIREINDVVGVAWKHVNGLYIVTTDFPFEHLTFRVVKIPLLDQAVAFDYYELFELCVVPVLALGDTGF